MFYFYSLLALLFGSFGAVYLFGKCSLKQNNMRRSSVPKVESYKIIE